MDPGVEPVKGEAHEGVHLRAKRMQRVRVAVHLAPERLHGLFHARVDQGRRVVIEIDAIHFLQYIPLMQDADGQLGEYAQTASARPARPYFSFFRSLRPVGCCGISGHGRLPLRHGTEDRHHDDGCRDQQDVQDLARGEVEEADLGIVVAQGLQDDRVAETARAKALVRLARVLDEEPDDAIADHVPADHEALVRLVLAHDEPQHEPEHEALEKRLVELRRVTGQVHQPVGGNRQPDR